jgi:sensor histidine kinase YesM
LRFGDEFSFSISSSDTIQEDDTFVHPMIIQPFIENALKHGLLHKAGVKNLQISFYEDSQFVYCEITDNGVGRTYSREINERQGRLYDSFSTEATEKRLLLLQNYYGKPYHFEIIDLTENEKATGTKVIIRFPVF